MIIQQILDPWIIFGFTAQFVFFLRFFVQWIVSEKHKRTVIPMSFWYLSVLGSLMILIYSIKRGDIVFITASCLNTLIYVRNIMLAKKPSEKKKDTLVN